MTGLYNKYGVPRLINWACSQEPVMRQRAAIVGQAEGIVVELGVGSGLNLSFYQKERVQHVVGIDRSAIFWELGRERISQSDIDIEFVKASAEALDLPHSFADTVVVTYTLCSIDNAGTALSEARRVLKPAGRLLFLEHGVAPDAALARWQDRLTPLTRRFAGGCRLNRNPEHLIRQAGFSMEHLETGWAAGFPRIASFYYSGSARPV